MPSTAAKPPTARTWAIAASTYVALLAAFWIVAQRFAMETRIGGHMPSSFASFALLLAPYWAFGFGAADVLRRLTNRLVRVLIPGLLLIPYLIFSIPRGQFAWTYAAALLAIPIACAALLEFLPPRHPGLCWQDVAVLLAVGLPVEFRWLAGAWPQPGLSALPKFLLVITALYAFLVVRRVDGVGFDFRPRWRDLAIGLREWAFYAPIAILLGLALHFLRFHSWLPSLGAFAAPWLITFFFVAIPEELFFRGLLQNLLEKRIGRRAALLAASLIFGLSHFNKGMPPFNWRYVMMATIAGVFYGRAWLDRRRLFTSAITHTTVDVVWGIWWRI